MEKRWINNDWPNALRYFLAQDLTRFTPWQFLSREDEFIFAAKAFMREDNCGGQIFVFASRQDNDDFAGLEIIEGKITDRVVYFHPVFAASAANQHWNIVQAVFEDVFEFVGQQVLPDMKQWSLLEDATELE